MSRPLLVADLFCGAGGTSTGAVRAIRALGREVRLVCVNHWPRAIETHRAAHPEARHFCADVASVRPAQAVPEGRLDLLMASPTCTHHSRARGGRPTSDQQRMDPWLVIAWLTELRVERLLIENVPEFADWGPVGSSTGRPIAARRGEYHREWTATIERLGFSYEWRALNAADYGAATTRIRYYGQGRARRGRAMRIAWPAPSHSRDGGATLFGALPRWRAAREVIDWSLEGRSIFGRKTPLSPKTLLRIHAGAQRLGWPDPFVVVLRRHMAARSIDLPLPAITAGGTHLGLAVPRPFILSQAGGGAARPVSRPMPTFTTGGRRGPGHALVVPYYGGAKSGGSVDDPLDTVTTKDRFGLVVPITHAGANRRVGSLDEPLPTLTTASRGELAFVVPGFGEARGQAPRFHGADAPLPAICAQGHAHVVEPAVREGEPDILFRMLHWRELARAMSFDNEGEDYPFAGTKTEITRQIGNAVDVRTAQALVGAALSDLAPAEPGAALAAE